MCTRWSLKTRSFRLGGRWHRSTSSPDNDGKIAWLLESQQTLRENNQEASAEEVFRTLNVQCRIPAFTSLSVSQTYWAALALGGLGGLAVTYILTHHVLTKHRPRFTYTDSTRLGVPYLIVGVDSAVRCAGIFVENNSKWHQCPESFSVSWWLV